MYNAPINIYVVWHPTFSEGERYAEEIYSHFNRSVKDPLSRGIGIPVFFRSVEYENGLPRPIALDQAKRNAIILLINDDAVINWKDYSKGLLAKVEESDTDSRIFPVSLTTAFASIGSISEVNFIRLHDQKDADRRKAKLLLELTHEIARLIHGKPRVSEGRQQQSPEPVKLFISHSKRDGAEIANKIKDYVDKHTGLSSFFDRVDIASGYRFDGELLAGVESAALLAVQSDTYSSRRWCRWEVMEAKKAGNPIVVVNAINDIEERSFPYMGNVPVIRWNPLENESEFIERILGFALHEILRYYYMGTFLRNLSERFANSGASTAKILSSPPELFTLLEKATEDGQGRVVIYPDPPLTREEQDLLIEAMPHFQFVTPTVLEAFSSKQNHD